METEENATELDTEDTKTYGLYSIIYKN